MDIERLIREVRARPVIWDQKLTAYYNRDVVCRAWGEVAEACAVSGEAVRCKWKHLRDNFRKEFKKSAKEADEGVNPENFQSGWVWYNNMRFLGDQLVARKTNPYTYTCKRRKSATKDGVGQNEEANPVTASDEMYQEDNSRSMYASSVGMLSDMQIPEVEWRCDDDDSKKLSDSWDSDYDFKSKKRKIFASSVDESDDTYHYLMSLMNPIKSLPYKKQMYVRFKIQELLFNETINCHYNKESNLTENSEVGTSNDLNN